MASGSVTQNQVASHWWVIAKTGSLSCLGNFKILYLRKGMEEIYNIYQNPALCILTGWSFVIDHGRNQS